MIDRIHPRIPELFCDLADHIVPESSANSGEGDCRLVKAIVVSNTPIKCEYVNASGDC